MTYDNPNKAGLFESSFFGSVGGGGGHFDPRPLFQILRRRTNLIFIWLYATVTQPI